MAFFASTNLHREGNSFIRDSLWGETSRRILRHLRQKKAGRFLFSWLLRAMQHHFARSVARFTISKKQRSEGWKRRIHQGSVGGRKKVYVCSVTCALLARAVGNKLLLFPYTTSVFIRRRQSDQWHWRASAITYRNGFQICWWLSYKDVFCHAWTSCQICAGTCFDMDILLQSKANNFDK